MRNRSTTQPVSRECGVSLFEILVVIALLAGTLLVTAGAMAFYQRRTALRSTARVTKLAIQRARILSVYRGLNHFVAFDPGQGTISIHEDSGVSLDSFDDGDPLVSRFLWKPSVGIALPTTVSLTDPLLGTGITSAWGIPDPDSGARWGSSMKGMMVTPRGAIFSAEATPGRIGVGTIVFHDPAAGTAAVSLNGRAGSVFAFRFRDGAWSPI